MREIQLTRGLTTIVSDEDFEWAIQWKWYANRGKTHKTFYAFRNSARDACGKRSTVILHREIALRINPEWSNRVDHRDGNGLNNQRSNLRMATHQNNTQNTMARSGNTSGFIGVYKKKRGSKYYAKLRNKNLGYFQTAIEAALARDAEARREYGEFGCFNFPVGGERTAISKNC